MSPERSSLTVALGATLLIHALFVAGLHAAEHFIGKRPPVRPMEVSFDVRPPPPPVAEPRPPEPPPEAPKAPPPKAPPPRRVASVTPPRPVPETPEPPAAGAPDEAPAPAKIYTLDSGSLYVNPGAPNGSATGVPGGTGKGTGGGAPAGSVGTGGPRPVALAAVKIMPQPIGEYDYNKDYPDEARKLGLEGQVAVRLLVDDAGTVAEARLVRGPGHGLDQKALELTRRIRFRPARDEADRPVATWITWTVSFTLPR